MTDLEIEKLAGELAAAIALAILPEVRAVVREEMRPKSDPPVGRPRHTITVPKRG